jgi:methionyl-tRNA formyltransferase
MAEKRSQRAARPVVIASSRPWNRDLSRRISAATGRKVVAITDPSELTADRLAKIAPEYVFFPHWSHIIKSDVYQSFACVIFHMTDLPYGRGGSPLQNLIVRGHTTTKISALKCVKDLDAGPIYLKRDLSLQGTAEEIFIRADTVIEGMIKDMIAKSLKARPQRGQPVLSSACWTARVTRRPFSRSGSCDLNSRAHHAKSVQSSPTCA